MITLPIFKLWDYRDFDVKNKLNEVAIKYFSPSVVDVFIENLTKQIKPVATEKNEYEFQDISIPIALLGFFGL